MIDLVRLREALAVPVWTRTSAGDELRAEERKAARAYADLLEGGEKVWWCDAHNAESIENHGGSSDECWRMVWVDMAVPEGLPRRAGLCRMVERLLLPEEKQ